MDKRSGAIAIALMVLCTATGARAQSPATPNQQQTEQGGGMGKAG